VPTVVREIIAGIGIRSTIKAGLVSYDANSIFQGAIGGLVQGVASIGINYATQELGLNPLLANLGFSAIASAINAGIQASTGGSQDVFKTFFDTYINNALTFLGYGNITDPNYLWLETSYKASILDFCDIVRQKGLVEALNIYGTSFFNSNAVGAIAQSGLTIGKYFIDKLNSGQGRVETKHGKTYTTVDTPTQPDGKKTTVFFEWITEDGGYWNPIGKEEALGDHTFWGLGELGKDSYGNLGFWSDATLIDTYSTFTSVQIIDNNGNLISIDIKDSQSDDLLHISSTDSTHPINYDSSGALSNGIVESHYLGDVNLKLTNGELENYYYYQPVNKFDSILSGDLKDGYGFQISKNADGTYNLQRTFGQTFVDIFRNGLGAINPFTPSGAKNLMTLFVPQNLATQIGQSMAQNVANTMQSRYNYFKSSGFGYTDNEAMAWAIYDTAGDLIGFTPLLEGIYGVDITTGNLLTGGQRAWKLGEGIVATVGNVIGGAQVLHGIQFVPKVGSALSSATTALRTFSVDLGEAGNVLIDPALSYAARNNASITLSGTIAKNFERGVFDVYTAGELRTELGLSGNLELARVFGGTTDFEGRFFTDELFASSKDVATRFLNLPDGNLATKVGWGKFNDDTLVFVGKVAGNENGGGLQFFVNQSDLDAGKVFFDPSTVLDLN